MNHPKSRWPARRSLALASMSLLLGAISLDADAVDKATRAAHDGRVFFPAEGSTQTYDSFIVYLRDDAKAGDDDITMPNAMIEFATTVWGQPEPERSSVTVATAVESLTYDALERTHGGWENNDGAYGAIIFDVADYSITLDYNERYTASENYTHSF